MTQNAKYKLAASALVLGVVLCAGGIFWSFSQAMNPPDEQSDQLALGEVVYLQTGSTKKYIGSYLGSYVVSTGGCNRMTLSAPNAWTCNRWTVQNGWGVLYKKVKNPTGIEDYVVSDAHALIPTTNNPGDNTFIDAQITSSRSGDGHIWTDTGIVRSGQIGVELVLYSLNNTVYMVFPD